MSNGQHVQARGGFMFSPEQRAYLARMAHPDFNFFQPLQGMPEGPLPRSEQKPAYQIRGRSIVEYSEQKINDDDNLLGNRWLERRRGALLTGPSGVGKSTAVYQAAACWSCGQLAFAIKPSNPAGLRVIIFQTEDSSNDLIEMSQCIYRLGFSTAQLELIRRNSHVETINDAVGSEFIARVDSSLGQKPSDLIILNPLSDFIPGELTDETQVKLFLRKELNSCLERQNCGALCVQPTPKTNRNSTDNYSWFDWQYWGAGSAEFARWARGAIVIVPTASDDTYRFIAAKRFSKLGWQYHEFWYSHSQENGVDLWIAAKNAQISAAKAKTALKPDDILVHIPLVDPISQAALAIKCQGKIGKHRRADFIQVLLEEHKIEEVSLPRNGVKSAIGYRRLK